jgi:hypothetical protein
LKLDSALLFNLSRCPENARPFLRPGQTIGGRAAPEIAAQCHFGYPVNVNAVFYGRNVAFMVQEDTQQ